MLKASRLRLLHLALESFRTKLSSNIQPKQVSLPTSHSPTLVLLNQRNIEVLMPSLVLKILKIDIFLISMTMIVRDHLSKRHWRIRNRIILTFKSLRMRKHLRNIKFWRWTNRNKNWKLLFRKKVVVKKVLTKNLKFKLIKQKYITIMSSAKSPD